MHWALWLMVWLSAASLAGRGLIRLMQRTSRAGINHPGNAIAWWYGRLMHRTRYEGLERIPRTGPLIIVSNHTSGLDPILIGCACPYKVRWMMASDYMSPAIGWFWRWAGVIPVERDGSDSGPLREAIRHVKSGGVVGVFPEGGIAKPPGEVRPFIPGIGLMVSRTGAPVLLVWVSGTPVAANAFGSLFKPSRSRVVFAGVYDFSNERDAATILRRLRDELARVSGWPLNDTTVPTARKRYRDPFGAP